METLLTIEKLVTCSLDTTVGQQTTYVGIDFGTSTTVVSIAYYDTNLKKVKCHSIDLEQRLPDGAIYTASKVPTVIALNNNMLLVGEGASELKYTLKKDKNIWYSFKMELGENLGPKYYESVLGEKARVQILNAKDATTIFFQYLKAQIEKYIQQNGLNTHIEYVISIPASFEANQRQDLIDALAINQIDVSKQALIDEPNAAFLSYIYEQEDEDEKIIILEDINPKVLVFDFGAGTCDISIIELGMNQNGLYTKNLSISKFEKLGGDDIDKCIVYELLLPQLLKQNGFSMDDFITSEKRIISNRLIKIAEQLKIKICKAVSLMRDGFDLSSVNTEEIKVSIKENFHIKTSKGELSMDEFLLSAVQFSSLMQNFTCRKQIRLTSSGNKYNSIYESINTSIKKSRLSSNDIDYVLFIGGSSQNPYIQAVIREWLPEAKLLLPRDMQIQVSQGAAIHSLLFNCYGQNIIQAITSEPICVVTQNGELLTLIPAGTTIPTNTITINNLVTAYPEQKIVELPICISNKNKLLMNFILESKQGSGFPNKVPIELSLDLSPDKLLSVTAQTQGEVYYMKPVNPFANKELTTQERIALKAERKAYEDAASNNGVPSKSCLLELARSYEDADLPLKAAETYEQCNDLYPGSMNYSRIGCLYSSAGRLKKALFYGEKDYETNRNAISAFNLGYRYRNLDIDKYLKYINESLSLSPNKPHALFELGRYERSKGYDSGIEKMEKAFNIWKAQYDAGRLSEVDYTWLPNAAEALGKYELAVEVRAKAKRIKETVGYNEKNAAQIKEEYYGNTK